MDRANTKDGIADAMGYLQGWMGQRFSFAMTRDTERLQSIWLLAYNRGRIRYLDEKSKKEAEESKAMIGLL